MNDTDIVFLEITTYMGMSFGAKHFYGELKGYIEKDKTKDVTLTHKLTAREAAELNKEGDWDLWSPGASYSGFLTKEEIIKIAEKEWKTHFPHASVLVLGRIYYGEPQTVLAGPQDYMETVNKWVEQMPENWNSDSDKIYEKFNKYKKEYELK